MNIAAIWESISNVIKSMLAFIINLLPKSPFIKILEMIGDIPFLNMINWFIPFDLIIAITEVWLVAIGIFYLYMIVLRWVKAID